MNPTSPLGSGAGDDFESEVGAVYLVALLLGSSARGAVEGGVVQVTFQQASLGAPLDDLCIEVEVASGQRLRLDLQIKRTFTFSPGDRNFASVVEKSWDTFRKFAFQDIGHRFGIALNHFPQKLKVHYVRVPVWAATSPSAEHFFDRIAKDGLSSKDMRRFVENLSKHLRSYAPGEATDESLWQFFRSLAIVDFDLEQPGSRDRMFAVELLRTLVPNGDLSASQKLFERVTGLVRAAKNTGGGYTVGTLRAGLLGISLLPSRVSQRDIKRLADHSDLVLGSIHNTIAGLVLDRSDLVGEVLGHVECGKTVFLLGSPGTGKSALARALAEIRRADGPIVALSHDRLSEAGWDKFAATLQLQASLNDLILSLSGTTRPCLILDGADRIEGPGPRCTINDLLAAISRLPKDAEGASRWGQLITLRSEMLGPVEEWLELPGRDIVVLKVSALSEDDLAALANERPHLREILASPQIGPVVRNPYFLRILEEVRGRDQESPDRPVTEAEVHALWWRRVVGKNQDRGRQQLLLQLGEEWLKQHTRRFLNRGLPPEILRGLENDSILRYHPETDSFVFGHDILEEWVAVRVLGQKEPDVLGHLQQLGNPFWARRALQLFACLRLEGESGVQSWRALLLAAEKAPEASLRWTDAVLTAPFRSARLQELMPGIGEVLLERGGSRLGHFLRALRTQAIEPNRSIEKRLREGSHRSPHMEALALEFGEPEESCWIPVLSWLVPRLLDLPDSCRDEASQVMAIWQRTVREGGLFRREIAEAALAWLSSLHAFESQPSNTAREADSYFKRLRYLVATSMDAILERAQEFFTRLRAAESTDNLKRWFSERSFKNLVQKAPAAYADFILDVLVPDWRQRRTKRASSNIGPRYGPNTYEERDPEWRTLKGNYAFQPPQGEPFLSILEADEVAGLHLVNTLVNQATASWLREVKLRGYSRSGSDRRILSFQSGKRRFYGDRTVYRWSQPRNEAPHTVRSALMALELWMKEQVKAGRSPEELFSAVLATSRSIATAGVCVTTFFAHPEKCLRAATPFVSHEFFWDCDSAIRSYIGAYIFSSDLALRDLVSSRVRRFRFGIFAAHANRSNYGRSEDGTILFMPPEKLVEPHRPFLQHLAVQIRHIELLNWVHEAGKKSPDLKGFTIAQAIERAQELQRPDDFVSPYSPDAEDFGDRLAAIVGAVTAALRLDLPLVVEIGCFPWCEEILIAASRTPCGDESGWRSVPSDDFVLAAAQGLFLLLEQGRSSERARQAAFDLLQRPEKDIIEYVFDQVLELWDLDPVFCRSAVARELALSVEPWREQEEPQDEFDSSTPRADSKVEEIKERYARSIREGRLPVAIGFGPLTSGERIKIEYVERALRRVPLDKISSESDLLWILEVTEQVLTWTLNQLKFQNSGQVYSRWMSLLGDWLARLSRRLPASEVESMILHPLLEGWPHTACLVEEILAGWTRHLLVPSSQISEESKSFWKALSETILMSPDQPATPLRERVLELLLHVWHGQAFLGEQWEGAPAFLNIYDRWVEIVAPTPWGFSRLLLFLNAAGKNLGVEQALRWLSSATTRSIDRDELWREHDNLSRTAELLAGLWESEAEQIQGTQGAHIEYASLLDELVRAGSPLAEQLRRKISIIPLR